MAEPVLEPHTPLAQYLRDYSLQHPYMQARPSPSQQQQPQHQPQPFAESRRRAAPDSSMSPALASSSSSSSSPPQPYPNGNSGGGGQASSSSSGSRAHRARMHSNSSHGSFASAGVSAFQGLLGNGNGSGSGGGGGGASAPSMTSSTSSGSGSSAGAALASKLGAALGFSRSGGSAAKSPRSPGADSAHSGSAFSNSNSGSGSSSAPAEPRGSFSAFRRRSNSNGAGRRPSVDAYGASGAGADAGSSASASGSNGSAPASRRARGAPHPPPPPVPSAPGRASLSGSRPAFVNGQAPAHGHPYAQGHAHPYTAGAPASEPRYHAPAHAQAPAPRPLADAPSQRMSLSPRGAFALAPLPVPVQSPSSASASASTESGASAGTSAAASSSAGFGAGTSAGFGAGASSSAGFGAGASTSAGAHAGAAAQRSPRLRPHGATLADELGFGSSPGSASGSGSEAGGSGPRAHNGYYSSPARVPAPLPPRDPSPSPREREHEHEHGQRERERAREHEHERIAALTATPRTESSALERAACATPDFDMVTSAGASAGVAALAGARTAASSATARANGTPLQLSHMQPARAASPPQAALSPGLPAATAVSPSIMSSSASATGTTAGTSEADGDAHGERGAGGGALSEDTEESSETDYSDLNDDEAGPFDDFAKDFPPVLPPDSADSELARRRTRSRTRSGGSAGSGAGWPAGYGHAQKRSSSGSGAGFGAAGAPSSSASAGGGAGSGGGGRAWALDLSAKMPAPPPRPLSVASSAKSTRTVGPPVPSGLGGAGVGDHAAGAASPPLLVRSGSAASSARGGATMLSGLGAGGSAARHSVLSATSSAGSQAGAWDDAEAQRRVSRAGSTEGDEAWAALSRERASAASLLGAPGAAARLSVGSASGAASAVSPSVLLARRTSDTARLRASTGAASAAAGRSAPPSRRSSAARGTSVPAPSSPLSAAPPRTHDSSPSASQARDARTDRPASYRDAALKFAVELAHALDMLFRRAIFPAVWSFLSLFAAAAFGLLPSTPTDKRALATHDDRVSGSAADAAQVERDTAQASKSIGEEFAEKFKYLICTSFLLTPSLSISFYDEAPPAPPSGSGSGSGLAGDGSSIDAHSSAGRRSMSDDAISPVTQLRKGAGKRRAAEQHRALCKQISGSTVELPSFARKSAGAASSMPALSPRGQHLRNALFIACGVLPLLTPTLAAWFRTTLLLSLTVWTALLGGQMHARSAQEDGLAYLVSHAAVPGARSIFSPATTAAVRTLGAAAAESSIANEGNAAARMLVEQLRQWDIEIKKALMAVKEAELVGRGFKLTHPLPPISRIEAAGGTAFDASRGSTLSSLASPPRPLATNRLSRAGSISRDVRRQSLTLSSAPSGSGRMSPSLFDTSADMDDGSSRRYSALTTYSSGSHMGGPDASQMRLLSVRKTLARVMDEAEIDCAKTADLLDQLIDKEEWDLLREMYSLDLAGGAAGPEPRDSILEATGMDSIAEVPSEHNGGSLTKTKRLSLLSGATCLDAEQVASPQPPRSGYKRLSLLGSGIKPGDAPLSSPLLGSASSKRNSMTFDDAARAATGASADGRTTPSLDPPRRAGVGRLAYVHSDASAAQPDSANSKRLSFASSAASHTAHNASATLMTPGDASFSRDRIPSPLLASSSPNMAASTFSRNASQRSSVILQPTDKPLLDPLSIAGLQARHEAVHRTRRKMLVRLLALRFDAGASYWSNASKLARSTASTFERLAKEVAKDVRVEMGLEPTAKTGAAAHLPPTAQAAGLEGHLGLEDRLSAMGIVLRSLQLKLRACANDLRVKAPPELHGTDPAADTPRRSSIDNWQATQTTFESIKDDLLGLCAEWEAGVNIFSKEIKRTASPKPQPAATPRSAGGPREFESPQEADEDAWQQADKTSGSATVLGDAGPLGVDHELLELVRQSTDPNHLPPPGLEQIFESIAGLASLDQGGAPSSLTREERIARTREERARKAEQQSLLPLKSNASAGSETVVISELKDVIAQLKTKRGLPPPEDPSKRLGSPLEIEDAAIAQNGRFSGVPSTLGAGTRSRGSSLSTSMAATPETGRLSPSPEKKIDAPAYGRRARAPSNGSDAAGKSSRRQSQAIDGRVSSGAGAGDVWGLWNPAEEAQEQQRQRDDPLSSVSEDAEGITATDATPTAVSYAAPARAQAVAAAAAAVAAAQQAQKAKEMQQAPQPHQSQPVQPATLAPVQPQLLASGMTMSLSGSSMQTTSSMASSLGTVGSAPASLPTQFGLTPGASLPAQSLRRARANSRPLVFDRERAGLEASNNGDAAVAEQYGNGTAFHPSKDLPGLPRIQNRPREREPQPQHAQQHQHQHQHQRHAPLHGNAF